ncbi:hypothetical protein CCACVL1_27065 [Corchorus capsularis]|uniref:Uncharacterized protein n=1 Tax=Corchorus capsularis TaxID=210143 RepID=A0A1R3GCB2_COCAP|nr:hypothetical protein CCACVL1_27065 [Corchorus capsularis]
MARRVICLCLFLFLSFVRPISSGAEEKGSLKVF